MCAARMINSSQLSSNGAIGVLLTCSKGFVTHYDINVRKLATRITRIFFDKKAT